MVPAKILILNGPNLNKLLLRDPLLYGTRSMEQIILDVQQAHMDILFTYRQSNHEGDLIDWLQQSEDYDTIIINAGGYTHTSIALRDAIEICPIPVIEVHLSDITQREPWRQHSLITDVCCQTIIGKDCYEKAVEYSLSLAH